MLSRKGRLSRRVRFKFVARMLGLIRFGLRVPDLARKYDFPPFHCSNDSALKLNILSKLQRLVCLQI